jgi:hypothetical protein
MFCKMNKTNKTFSHCGMYLIVNDTPYIYHSIGGEDNPDAKIRRESLTSFLNPAFNNTIGVYRFNFNNTQIKDITKYITQWYNEQRTFDMSFDLKTDNKLYCVEYISKAIEKGLQDSSYIPKSFIESKKFYYVAPDNLLLHKNIQKVYFAQYLIR